jgi:hypothetical protein
MLGDHIEVDWPRSIGYFGALGAGVAFELIPLPIALFVASVPFLKMFSRPNAPRAQRFMSQLVDGASLPVGGDSEGTVRWTARSTDPSRRRRTRSTGGRR